MANALLIYLFVIINRGDGDNTYIRTPFADWVSCHKALAASKINTPNGAENEVAVVTFCAGEQTERWWEQWRKM